MSKNQTLVQPSFKEPMTKVAPKVKVLANGKVLKVQKTRQRKILSCVYCHSKKIKCSRILPCCNNCEKLGIDCTYFVNDRVSRGGKNKKSEPVISPDDGSDSSSKCLDDINISDLADVHSDINSDISSSHMTDMASAPSDDKSPTTGKAVLQTPVLNASSNNITNNYFNTNYMLNNNGAPNTIKSEDQVSFNLSSFAYNTKSLNNPKEISLKNIASPSMFASPTSNEEAKFSFPTNPEGSPTLQHADSSTNISALFLKSIPALYSSGSPVNFLESSNASQFQSGNNFMLNFSNNGTHNLNSSYETAVNPTQTKNFLNGTNTYYDNENLLSDLESFLPNSKERSFELINRYLNSVHILLPIVPNLEEFKEEHESFWRDWNPYDKESNNTLTDFNFIQFYTLYFPIIYASTISEFEEYDNLLLNQDIDKYLRGFNKICQYYNYPHGLKTIPLLLGNVIIQSTSPNPSTMEMSQIIRYAKFLQMNKDPVLTLKITNDTIIQFRRMLWWTIFGLDCLTSHNFCLPPVCKHEDFNVLLPSDEEPVYNSKHELVAHKLNISKLSLNIKFKYDIILNDLVVQLHNENLKNISNSKMNEIKMKIIDYFEYVHLTINKMNCYHKKNPPTSVNETNLVQFIKNYSWSFVDRALMLLHKKYLLNDFNLADLQEIPRIPARRDSNYNVNLTKPRDGKLSLSVFEDTYQSLIESNLIKNFINHKNLTLNLDFNQFDNFNYNDLNNNLIPSLLHNLNDFLKYNDFLKFGKFNWYVKRTIPLDSIIILFIVMIIKFKNQNIMFNELIIYVKLINKSLFILNRKWFKNEKYKRMLSLTNLTWEFILKKFNILGLINKYTNSNFSISTSNNRNKIFNKYEYFNYQLTGYFNTTELFKSMEVPQPILSLELINRLNTQKQTYQLAAAEVNGRGVSFDLDDDYSIDRTGAFNSKHETNLDDSTELVSIENDFQITKSLLAEFKVDHQEINLLIEKIFYDLKNNYVDINDYCAFYISLENVLHELITFIQG